jgi:tripartite ATP-independent transporter DctP family solute receptor
MPVINRRRVMQGGLAVAAAGALRPRTARAAEFAFKLGVDWPADHPGSMQAKAACDRVRERTNGRLDIQFFPNNQLGSDTDMLSQLRSGALEMLLLGTGVLSTFQPVAAINNVGFAFADYDQVWKAMDGSLGSLVRDQLTKSGIVTMEKIWDNGFRQMTTSGKMINSIGDVAGLKIRVPVSSIYTSMWTALGAAPASVNVNELYSALQTKVYDGQENPLPNIQFFKLYEVQKTCALTSHMWEGFWLLINRRAWASLPADLQAIVTREMNDGAIQDRVDMAAYSASAETLLKQEGMTFTTPDRVGFRDKLAKAGFYAQWQKSFGDEAWSRLQAVSGPLG